MMNLVGGVLGRGSIARVRCDSLQWNDFRSHSVHPKNLPNTSKLFSCDAVTRSLVSRSPSTTWFPACQVRVVRILCQLPSAFSSSSFSASSASSGWQCSRRTSTASVYWQCSPPDLNREGRLAVFPGGPQPRVPVGSSVPRRTSTASFGWQCSPPDLNHQLSDRSGRCRTSPDRMSELMSESRSDFMLIECQNVCQIDGWKNVRQNVRMYAR